MTISNPTFVVRAAAPATATRPNGLAARQKLKSELQAHSTVVVDMEGVLLTPSFADEFLGVLLVELGADRFRRTVKIINVAPSARPLLRQVLTRRASKPNVDVDAHNALHETHLVVNH